MAGARRHLGIYLVLYSVVLCLYTSIYRDVCCSLFYGNLSILYMMVRGNRSEKIREGGEKRKGTTHKKKEDTFSGGTDLLGWNFSGATKCSFMCTFPSLSYSAKFDHPLKTYKSSLLEIKIQKKKVIHSIWGVNWKNRDHYLCKRNGQSCVL